MERFLRVAAWCLLTPILFLFEIRSLKNLFSPQRLFLWIGRLGATGLITLITFAGNTAQAQMSPEVGRGLSWLQAQIQADGSLFNEPQSIATTLQSRTETAQTLKLLASSSNMLTSAIGADNQNNTEYLSRKIIALAINGWDTSTYAGLLLQRQNLNSGFGGDAHYISNIIDTSWSLLALAQAGKNTSDASNRARAYLVRQLAVDGGMSGRNEWARITHSAIALLALQTTPDSSNAVVIKGLASWLLQKQSANGGWADNSYLTAIVLAAITPLTSDATVRAGASAFLLSKQAADGSWNADPFLTAVVLRALSAQSASTTGSGSILQGQVIDRSTNVPLSSVLVTLNGPETQNISTDANGKFAFAGLKAGIYSVSYTRSGYSAGAANYIIHTNQTSDAGIVGLTQTASASIIRGQVTTTDNVPLAGVAIALTGSVAMNTTTDVNGRYEILVTTPGTFTITAASPGYQSSTGNGILATGQTLFFSPVLYSNSQIAPTTIRYLGKVVSAGQGTPLAGVAVEMTGTANASTITTVSGQFEANMAPGSYVATYTLAGYASVKQIFVAPAGTTVDAGIVTLSPIKSSTSIKGIIVDTANVAIAGASVRIIDTSLTAITAADGSYTIDNVSESVFSVRVSATGYDSQTIGLQVSAPSDLVQNFTLNAQTAGPLSFTALTSDQAHYGAYSPVSFQVQVLNSSNETISRTVGINILNSSGKIVDIVQAAWVDASENTQAQFNFPPGVTNLTVPWTTRAFAPGNYGFVAGIFQTVNISEDSTLVLAERKSNFSIDPTEAIHSVTISPWPRFTNFGATEALKFNVDIVNHSNVPVSSEVTFHLKTPSGSTVYTDSVAVQLLPSESKKSVELGGPSYTFVESGLHSVDVQTLNGPTPLSITGRAISVAPRISIEPSQQIAPAFVTPDGDKKVKLDVKLKGIGRAPGTSPTTAMSLTGASISALTAEGAYVGNGWDTTHNNWVCDVYVQTQSGGAFVNPNPSGGTSSRLKLDISTPGIYTLFYRTDGNGWNWRMPLAGINLFFNNSLAPAISASIPFNIAFPELTAFGNGALGIVNGITIPGANALYFTEGDLQVKMTAANFIDYRNPAVQPIPTDLAGCSNSSSNGITDYSGVITLEVLGDRDPNYLLRNVRIIETLSNLNAEIDLSSFVKQPYSVTEVGDQKIVEWRYDAFSASSTDSLGFDVLLKNLVPGEKRLVSHKVELLYDDVNGNPVRVELDPQYVTVTPSIFHITPTTDKASYGANSIVQVTSIVENLSASAAQGTVRLSVKDANNILVSVVGTSATQTIAAGASGSFTDVQFPTGNTHAGNYIAVTDLVDHSGKVIATGSTPFTIVADSGASATASITTDKQVYQPSDSVKLLDRLTSLTSNVLLNDLRIVTKVKNADGILRFTASEALPQLAQGTLKDYSYSVPLNFALAGQYTATLTVTTASGIQLAQSSTTFIVASTSDSGSGLGGTIGVSPKQVSLGDVIVFNFSASNAGNSALADLALKVSIVDPAAQKIMAEFPYTQTLEMGRNFTGASNWSTTGVAGAKYVAVLSATVGGKTLTLAQDGFELTSTQVQLDITQQASAWQNVLVYSACKRAADDLLGQCGAKPIPVESAATLAACDSTRSTALISTLNSLGLPHKVTSSASDFLRDVRTGLYNTYWISNGATAMREPAASEVRAAVLRGEGLLIDGLSASRNLQLSQCAGVSYNGPYAIADQILNLTGDLYTTGTGAFRITALPAKLTAVSGSIAQAQLGAASTTDGIVSGQYGSGKTLAFSFDLAETLRAQTQESRWPGITQKSFGYLKPSAQSSNEYSAGQVFTLSTRIRNGGQAADLQVIQTLPPGAQVIATDPVAQIATPVAGTTATWTVTLPANGEQALNLRLRVPTTVGNASIATITNLVKDSTATLFNTQSYDITVTSASQLLAQWMSSVAALDLTAADQLAVRKAIMDELSRVQLALMANSVDEALRRLLSVQGRIPRIDSNGTHAASLARLIAAVEWQSAK